MSEDKIYSIEDIKAAHYAGWYNGLINAYKHEFSWSEYSKQLSPQSDTDWKQKYLESQSELTALRGVHEYTKLRLSECENMMGKTGREG